MFLMLLLKGVDEQMFTALGVLPFIKCMLEIGEEKDVSQYFSFFLVASQSSAKISGQMHFL